MFYIYIYIYEYSTVDCIYCLYISYSICCARVPYWNMNIHLQLVIFTFVILRLEMHVCTMMCFKFCEINNIYIVEIWCSSCQQWLSTHFSNVGTRSLSRFESRQYMCHLIRYIGGRVSVMQQKNRVVSADMICTYKTAKFHTALSHYSDVIVGAMASQITSLSIVYSTVYLGRLMKASKLRVTGLSAGNSPVTGEFPAQRASNPENVSIWWRHHGSGKTVGPRWLWYAVHDWRHVYATAKSWSSC